MRGSIQDREGEDLQSENRALLEEGLKAYGGPLDEANSACSAVIDRVEWFLREVAIWNERVNLTAITDEREMVLKHAIDSMTVAGAVGLGARTRILDVGTGAGFPGIVLKLMFPQIKVVLLETLAKRCRFLEHVRSGLGLQEDDLEILCGRAEDWGKKAGYRESFDVVTARAVAGMKVLLEYTLPFCKLGGTFVAMKGPGVETELAMAENALQVLGGRVKEIHAVKLPAEAGERTLVEVVKVASTPSSYPRRAGTPERNAL